MMEGFPDFAVVGVIALAMLAVVLNFLKRKKNGSLMERQIDDLHKWHDKEDEEGRKAWYVPRSLETALVKLSEAVEANTEVNRDLHREITKGRSP
jgi:hypothetical protein